MDANWMVKDLDGNTSTESVGSEEGKRGVMSLIASNKIMRNSYLILKITLEHRSLYVKGLARRRKTTAAKAHSSSLKEEEEEEEEATQKRIAAQNFMIHHGSIGM